MGIFEIWEQGTLPADWGDEEREMKVAMLNDEVSGTKGSDNE